MKTILRFDFCEPGTVKSAIKLSGRGIAYICTQIDGTLVYSVSFAAQKKLIAKYGGTYTNDNGQVSDCK